MDDINHTYGGELCLLTTILSKALHSLHLNAHATKTKGICYNVAG